MSKSSAAIKITPDMSDAQIAEARKPVRRAVIASVAKIQAKKKEEPPAEKIALLKQTIRAEVEHLNDRAKQAWSFGAEEPQKAPIADASPEQIAILSALKAQREKRKALEVQLALLKTDEDAIAAPLKEWMRANGKTMIRAAGAGRYCREQKAAGVSLREPSESFTLRS